jgi:purine-binding chemotaxis protein CheW
MSEVNTGGPLGREQYLMFRVANTEMVVPLSQVTETLPYERVNALPGMPAFVRGVVQVRGQVVMVVDLAQRLGLTGRAELERTSIVMLDVTIDGARLPLGVAVSGVATLIELDASSLQPPPFVSEDDARYLEGLFSTGDRLLPLIKVERMFGKTQLRAISSMLQKQEADDDYLGT